MFMPRFLHLRLIRTNVSFRSSMLGNELIAIANAIVEVHPLLNSVKATVHSP